MFDMNCYKIVDATDRLRIALKKDLFEQFNNRQIGCGFVKTMDALAKEIISLPLNYKKPIRFSFLVLPAGKEYTEAINLPIEDGICEAPIVLYDNYPLSLCIDDFWFSHGFLDCSFELKVGLLHELSHVVHGGYFRNLGQISEGFAELLPHYLMNLEKNNSYHQNAIYTFAEDDMQTMSFVNEKGMFAVDNINEGQNTQQMKSYMSVYLWMLAYIRRLERKHNMDKFSATNFMLNEFSKIDNLDWNKKTKIIADMVDISQKEMMNNLTLQKEGKEYIIQTLINKQFS